MICKHITKRSYQRKAFLYCRKQKKVITFEDCKNCSKIESRAYKGLNKSNKPIKKKSNKLAKLERERDKGRVKSGYCQCCGKYSSRLDPHEVFGGSNRQRSIKYGFVRNICRICHSDENKIMQLRKEVQEEFETEHEREEFIKLIGMSYLD